MPVRSDDPLRRVTLNLYEADCVAMEKLHAHGWTTRIRDLVHREVLNSSIPPLARTLGDLPE